jgi:hypothetical protein
MVGVVVGRLMGDIAEWLRRRREARDDLRFAKGYLAAIEAFKSGDDRGAKL